MALKNLTISFNEGEFAGIVGPSGSGKTTLLNIIGSLDKPTQGEAIVLDQNLSDLTHKKAAYLRNITLRPSLIKDWFFFGFAILVVNSIAYVIMSLFFDININYPNILVNILFTFLFYIIFSNIFEYYHRLVFGAINA